MLMWLTSHHFQTTGYLGRIRVKLSDNWRDSGNLINILDELALVGEVPQIC